jgi:hypothetical protein
MLLDRDDSQLTAAAGYRVADLASDLVAVMEVAGFERFSVSGDSGPVGGGRRRGDRQGRRCAAARRRAGPPSWPGSTACPARSERWVSRNGTLAKDSAHPACRRTARAHSSVEEHSPYKRRVTGSNPVAPTRSEDI